MVANRFLFAAWVLLSAIGMHPSLAASQCNETQRTAAVPRVVAAREAAEAGDHAQASAEYEEAYAACRDPWLLPYVAIERIRAGRYRDGLDAIQMFEAANLTVPAVPAGNDESREAQQARQRIAAFQEIRSVRELALRQVARLTLFVDPEHATVTINEAPAPLENGRVHFIFEDDTSLAIRVEAEGYRPIDLDVPLHVGANREEHVDLQPESAVVEPLDVDPQPQEPAPAAPRSRVLQIIGLAVTGTGAVLTGLGISAIVDANQADDALDTQENERDSLCVSNPELCSDADAILESNERQTRQRRSLGVAGAVVGGILMAGGVTMAILGAPASSEAEPQAHRCRIGLAGLDCTFSF